jgi:amyloid beta A4 protein
MKLHSFAMLEPCGLSLFRGVEYVCCPRAVEAEFMIENEYSNTDENDEDDEDDDGSFKKAL